MSQADLFALMEAVVPIIDQLMGRHCEPIPHSRPSQHLQLVDPWIATAIRHPVLSRSPLEPRIRLHRATKLTGRWSAAALYEWTLVALIEAVLRKSSPSSYTRCETPGPPCKTHTVCT
jgi:hypothetical protein